MNTDPNPFRESPDSDRSSSSTEAPDDSTRDFAEADEQAGGSSPMSEDTEDETSNDAPDTEGDDSQASDRRISGEPTLM